MIYGIEACFKALRTKKLPFLWKYGIKFVLLHKLLIRFIVMSIAEYKARKFFDTYQLGKMSDDVKMHLIVLLAQTTVSGKYNSYSESLEDAEAEERLVANEDVPPMLSAEDIQNRMTAIDAEIKAGKTQPIDGFFEEMEEKYPWLCK